MKTIMILGASILQLPAIREAKAMGLRVVAVDMNSEAIGFTESGIVKEVISTIDIPGVLEAAKRNHIDGIMTLASDMPMQTVAAVSKELGLIGIDEATALRATNKIYMRRALKEHDVPIPAFFEVSDYDGYIKAIDSINGKAIIKPADNSGSRGVFLIEKKSEQREIEYAYEYSKKYSRSGNILVEEYMQGREVSVESVSIDSKPYVIQITDKLTTGAPRFVEMGHSQPAAFDVETVEEIRKTAAAAINAIGIKNGPSHTEIMVTETGPKIVELGARLGGDCITTHLVPLSTGVNIVKASIQIALGITPDLTPKFTKGSAIRYIPCSVGKLLKIEGLKDAKAVAGITEACIVKQPGENISAVSNSADRLGFVIAQDGDAKAAVSDCEKALKKINVELSR